MTNHNLLKKSLESLKMIRVEMHDVMDSSKREELDRVIKDLEQCGTTKSSAQLLEILGSCIKWIPAVERFLKMLSEL